MDNIVLSNAGVISTHPLHTYVKKATAGWIVLLVRSKKKQRVKKKNSSDIYVSMSSMFKHKHIFISGFINHGFR